MIGEELLRLAAKAAGYKVRWLDESYYGPTMEIMEDDAGGPPWNPLKDDGDALRLAVKLNLAIILTGVAVNVSEIGGRSSIEPVGDDPYTATRRAIVRAAAEIGRNNETV